MISVENELSLMWQLAMVNQGEHMHGVFSLSEGQQRADAGKIHLLQF